jgi:hypothetical protein
MASRASRFATSQSDLSMLCGLMMFLLPFDELPWKDEATNDA